MLALQSGATGGQTAIATIVLIIGLVLVAVEMHRQRFRDLPTDLKERARARFGARAAAKGKTVRIEAGAQRIVIERRIRELLSDQPRGLAGESPVSAGETRLRDAATAVRGALRSVWGERLAGAPSLSIRLVEEALPIAIFGSVTVFSIEAWRRWLLKGDGVNLSAWVEEAGLVTADVLGLLADIITAFPYFQSVLSLAFAYSVSAASWLYDHPLVVAGILVGLALGIAAVHRSMGEHFREPFYPSRWLAGLKLSGALFAIWTVGVVPAKIGSVLGAPRWGGIAGLVGAGILAAWFSVRAVRSFIGKIRERGQRDGWMAAAMALGWRSGAIASIAAIPLLVTYIAVALLTGKLLGVAEAVLSGSLTVRVIVATIGFSVLALVVRDAREAWDEVRAAVRESASKLAIRGLVMRRALPVGLVAIGFLAGLESGFPVVPAAVAAILLGLVVRSGAVLYLRAYQRARLSGNRTRTASRAIVTGYVLEGVDGPIYYVEVNTIPLAARDRDRAIEAAADVAEQLFEDGDVEPSIEQAFADDLFRGVVDCEEMRAIIERDVDDQVRSAIVDGYRDERRFPNYREKDERGSIPQADLEDELDRYPPSVWRERLRELRASGVLRLSDGHYFYLGGD